MVFRIMSHLGESREIISVGLCIFSLEDIERYLYPTIKIFPLPLQQEINKYHRPQDKMSRVVSRLLINYLIKKYFNTENFIFLKWRRDHLGRPFLEGMSVDFSISHSQLWVAAGISLKGKIGIDLEVYRKINIDMFKNYFTQKEMEQIKKSFKPYKEAIKRWSRREAILKADGRGLLVPEDLVRNIDMLVSPRGYPWRIKEILFPEACLYIASENPFFVFDFYNLNISDLTFRNKC